MFSYLKKYINIPLSLLLLYKLTILFMPAKGGRETIPTDDSVFFMSIAYNILHFGDLGWVAYHEPVFYSIMIAIFSFFSDNLLNAAVLVSKTSNLLLIIVTFLLGKRIYGNTVGIASAVLVSFMPHIISIASRPESESLFAFLITLSIYLLWMTYKKPSVTRGILAGLAFTAAYLTRSEGVIILLFLLASLIIIGIKKRSIDKKVVVAIITLVTVFFVSSLPYLIFLKNHYGTWTVGTKTSGIYFWLRNKTFDDPDPNRTEWGLSPKGELNLISLTSKDVINYWLKDPSKSIKVYLHNLKTELPGFIPNDSGTFHFPQVYPIYLILPLLAGLMIKYLRKKSMDSDIYLLSVFSILFIYPFLTGGWWRYLVNYSPILMILAANGMNELNDFVKESVVDGISLWKRAINWNYLLWLFALVVTVYHLWVVTMGKLPEDQARYNYQKYRFALETKKAGEWAQKRFPPGANFMAQWSKLAYYLNGRWTAMPETNNNGIIWYARKNRVDYLVFETSGRGESEEIVRVMGNTRDLKVAGIYESPEVSYGVVFLELKK